jgi:hypothetical protein
MESVSCLSVANRFVPCIREQTGWQHLMITASLTFLHVTGFTRIVTKKY